MDIFLIRIPRLNDRITKEECDEFGFDWVEKETNYELMLVCCAENNLKQTIEDYLNVINAEPNGCGTWTVQGFDELKIETLESKFQENGKITIEVEKLDGEKLKEFLKHPRFISRVELFTYCF